MQDKLNIPAKIKVGFQNRGDTYTKKLAYVTWIDGNNNIKQERSWEGWRDKKIEPLELDNEPVEGFVLNKKVGGYRSGWNNRGTYVRVYDPRGFEFEISVPNLVYILEECSSIKGKGLEGAFVYAWGAGKVILMPTSSQEYKTAIDLSELQAKKITKNDMREGCIYKTKKGDEWIYMGRFTWIYTGGNFTYSNNGNWAKKKHIFINTNKLKAEKIDFDSNSLYELEVGFTKLAEKLTEEPIDGFSDIFEGMSNSVHMNIPVDIVEVGPYPFKMDDRSYYSWDSVYKWLRDGDGYLLVNFSEDYNYGGGYNRYYHRNNEPRKYMVRSYGKLSVENNKVIYKNTYVHDRYYMHNRHKDQNTIKSGLTQEQVLSLPTVRLDVILENGKQIHIEKLNGR